MHYTCTLLCDTRILHGIYVTGYEPGCTIAGSGLDPRTRAGLLSPAQVLDNLVFPPIPIRCTFIMHDTGRMKYNDR